MFTKHARPSPGGAGVRLRPAGALQKSELARTRRAFQHVLNPGLSGLGISFSELLSEVKNVAGDVGNVVRDVSGQAATPVVLPKAITPAQASAHPLTTAGGTNWVLYAGLGLGALALILVMKKGRR